MFKIHSNKKNKLEKNEFIQYHSNIASKSKFFNFLISRPVAKITVDLIIDTRHLGIPFRRSISVILWTGFHFHLTFCHNVYYFCDSKKIIENSRWQLFFCKIFVVIVKNSDILFGSDWAWELNFTSCRQFNSRAMERVSGNYAFLRWRHWDEASECS